MKLHRNFYTFLLTFLISFVLYFTGHAQSEARTNPQLGLHYTASQYLHDNFRKKYVSGYEISFTNELKRKYDYQIIAGGSSPDFSISKSNDSATGLVNYIDLNIIRRLLSNNVRFNPFVSAGLGIQFYNSGVSPLLTASGGFKLRLTKGIYLLPQINFNIHTKTTNALRFNIGILGTLKYRKSEPVVAIVGFAPIENNDLDGDGILNDLDSCPTVKGTIAFHGCPDSDGDGIPDFADSCKTIPGFIEFRGCPAPKEIAIKSTNIQKSLADSLTQRLNEIGTQIYFESNLYTLTPLSVHMVGEIATILKNHPSYSLEIHGHTDSTGNLEQNRLLSQQRSAAVKDILIQFGISSARLQTFGWGSEKPKADNSTPEGRQRNRRTEFRLVELMHD